MKNIVALAAALGFTMTSAMAGGFVAPVVEVQHPIIVEERAASSNAGLVVPTLLLLGVIAAVVSDSEGS